MRFRKIGFYFEFCAQFQCGEGDSHTHHQTMLGTSAGCPMSQFSSHSIYPEITPDSTGKGLDPIRPPSTSQVNCKPWLLQVLLANWL